MARGRGARRDQSSAREDYERGDHGRGDHDRGDHSDATEDQGDHSATPRGAQNEEE